MIWAEGKASVAELDPQTIKPSVRVLYEGSFSIEEDAVRAVLRQPFNLQIEPPVRWVILQDASGLRVFLVAHHIAVDGTSMSILSREFLDLLDDQALILPPPVDFSRVHVTDASITDCSLMIESDESHSELGSHRRGTRSVNASLKSRCAINTSGLGALLILFQPCKTSVIIEALNLGQDSPRRSVF